MKDYKELAMILIAVILSLLVLFSIPLPKPPAPTCKVCHCHRVECHSACSEENMCVMRCESLCQKNKGR